MWIFYWLIAIMPLDEHPFWGKELVGSITIIKLVGFLALGAALYKASVSSRPLKLLQTPQAKWYVGLLLFQLASFFVHAGQLQSGQGAFAHVLSIFMLFLMVPAMVDDFSNLNRTLLVAIGAIGFVSLYAVRQGQKYGGDFRASGLFNDSNEYALIAGLWMPLAFLWIFSRRHLWERLFCCGALIVSLIGTVLAASRGSSTALAAGVLYLILRSGKAVRHLAIVTVVVVPLLIVFPNSVLHRFQNPGYGDQVAAEARLISWRAGMRMIQAYPLTGVGIHNFKPMATAFEGQNDVIVVKLAHNTYIELAAELGIPGMLAFVGVLLAALYSLEISRRRARWAKSAHLANVALGMQAGVIQYAIGAFFITAWWEKMSWFLIFCTIAMHRLCAVRAIREQRRRLAARDAEAASKRQAPELACIGTLWPATGTAEVGAQ